MNKKVYIIVAVLLALLLLTLFELFLGKNSLLHQKQLAEEIASYQAEIDSLKEVIEVRNAEIERLQNDSMYKETILRTRYGMSRESEKVFQLVEPKPEK
ncbi:septum formation initiator family protein [Fibrobacter sp.]|uniref:FtsB family cell division protein n=1 Tax=Fibrobacter sp. TaxID=35828 RepID=UPI001B1F9051|nr:septum formation initiator family protein [Fibrobacter sp.]MBO7060834.1 septum formation initiator family protein [Fibrobacter sp.]MBO7104121.1 septum formation initiator family protein [Fibrobacter sp.]MBR3669289.1 septum formation initiator family protein [Fibrobacter sp.]